jgi:hypothetical protein
MERRWLAEPNIVIASEATQSMVPRRRSGLLRREPVIGRASRDPLAPRKDERMHVRIRGMGFPAGQKNWCVRQT